MPLVVHMHEQNSLLHSIIGNDLPKYIRVTDDVVKSGARGSNVSGGGAESARVEADHDRGDTVELVHDGEHEDAP